jgi:hypothetical protein
MEDGKYVDKKTGIAYYDAPACYQPLSISEEKYGILGEVELFKMVGADPKSWLCEKTGTIFYAEGVTLPAVNEMTVSYLSVVNDDKEVTRITDAAVIASLASTYVNGAEIEKPHWLTDAYVINWRLKFVDETLGICYVLEYYELSEDYVVTDVWGEKTNYGKKFIYNRFENDSAGKMVAADDILASYVESYKAQNGAN